jgi:hypothetical protein
MKLSWKIYDADGDYIAGCAYALDAARLAAANGDGTTICASDHPDRSWTLWTEGVDGRAQETHVVFEHMRTRLRDLQHQTDAKREARRPVVAATVMPETLSFDRDIRDPAFQIDYYARGGHNPLHQQSVAGGGGDEQEFQDSEEQSSNDPEHRCECIDDRHASDPDVRGQVAGGRDHV